MFLGEFEGELRSSESSKTKNPLLGEGLGVRLKSATHHALGN
jgi:hypothetical protein